MVWAIAHRAKTSTGLVSRFRLHSSSSSSPAPQPPTQLSAFAHLLDLSGCGGVASEDAPRDGELVIREGFLSPQEHDLLVDACSRKLGRLARGPYAEGHFDQVIKGYKEASISSWSRTPLVAATSVLNNADEGPVRLMARFRTAVNEELQCRGLEPVKDWLDPHILELREGNSGIGAHVDNLQASGSLIAGLCLISPAVFIFRRVDRPHVFFSALLPPGSMYIQRGSLRYEYTHEIPLDPSAHVFLGSPVVRGRRISIMLRNRNNASEV